MLSSVDIFNRQCHWITNYSPILPSCRCSPSVVRCNGARFTSRGSLNISISLWVLTWLLRPQSLVLWCCLRSSTVADEMSFLNLSLLGWPNLCWVFECQRSQDPKIGTEPITPTTRMIYHARTSRDLLAWTTALYYAILQAISALPSMPQPHPFENHAHRSANSWASCHKISIYKTNSSVENNAPNAETQHNNVCNRNTTIKTDSLPLHPPAPHLAPIHLLTHTHISITLTAEGAQQQTVCFGPLTVPSKNNLFVQQNLSCENEQKRRFAHLSARQHVARLSSIFPIFLPESE